MLCGQKTVSNNKNQVQIIFSESSCACSYRQICLIPKLKVLDFGNLLAKKNTEIGPSNGQSGSFHVK